MLDISVIYENIRTTFFFHISARVENLNILVVLTDYPALLRRLEEIKSSYR